MDEGRLAEAEGCFRAAAHTATRSWWRRHEITWEMFSCARDNTPRAAACYAEGLARPKPRPRARRSRSHTPPASCPWRPAGRLGRLRVPLAQAGLRAETFGAADVGRHSFAPAGKYHLALHAEQGLGDTVQFVQHTLRLSKNVAAPCFSNAPKNWSEKVASKLPRHRWRADAGRAIAAI